jgi:hypothetical protein
LITDGDAPTEGNLSVCIVRFDLHFTDVKDTDKDKGRMPSIEYALRRLDPSSLRDDGGDKSPEDRCAIQGLEFFDEHEAVLVCKVGTEEGERDYSILSFSFPLYLFEYSDDAYMNRGPDSAMAL